jgi:hypothetical protein
MDLFEQLKQKEEEKKKAERLKKQVSQLKVEQFDREFFKAVVSNPDPDEVDFGVVLKNPRLAFQARELQTVFVSDHEDDDPDQVDGQGKRTTNFLKFRLL